jgi:hypothetical protein
VVNESIAALLAELLEFALDLALDAKLLGSSLEEGKKLGPGQMAFNIEGLRNLIVAGDAEHPDGCVVGRIFKHLETIFGRGGMNRRDETQARERPHPSADPCRD